MVTTPEASSEAKCLSQMVTGTLFLSPSDMLQPLCRPMDDQGSSAANNTTHARALARGERRRHASRGRQAQNATSRDPHIRHHNGEDDGRITKVKRTKRQATKPSTLI